MGDTLFIMDRRWNMKYNIYDYIGAKSKIPLPGKGIYCKAGHMK
jgi:hypothetical protein